MIITIVLMAIFLVGVVLFCKNKFMHSMLSFMIVIGISFATRGVYLILEENEIVLQNISTVCSLAMWVSWMSIVLVFFALFLIELRKRILKDKEDLLKRIQEMIK